MFVERYASRDRHVAKAAHEAAFGDLTEGFNAETTVGQLPAWWLEQQGTEVGAEAATHDHP